MTKVLCQVRMENDQEKVLLFYLERIMEQIEAGCVRLAKKRLIRYRSQFESLLKPAHLARLEQLANQSSEWTVDGENKYLDRIKTAWEFGEYKTVHDCGHEILLHLHYPLNGHAQIHDQVQEILAANNFHYIEPDDININTFIDASVSFIVEKRKSQNNTHLELRGNPGFYLVDALGVRYRCFIKQIDHAEIGDHLQLKITNMPGLAFASQNSQEPILYLEPRVSPGDIIEIDLGTLSHTENSYTFRYHSYDGFLWFKRRGVNKNQFNKSTLRSGERVVARVLYTTEEERRSSAGQITRLGIIKAIPMKRVDREMPLENDPDTDVAKVLN